MAIKKNFVVIIGLITTVFVLTGCPTPCLEAAYSFSAEVTLTPGIDSIQLGDTILLESSFSTKLFDKQSNSFVDYSNAKTIGGTIGLADLSKIGTLTDSSTTKNFRYVNFKGRIYNSSNVPIYWSVNQTNYEEENSQYKLKTAIITLKKGSYMLILGNALSTGRNKSRNCEKADFSTIISNNDNHMYIYEQASQNALSDDDRRRSYCFTVY